MQLLPGLLGLPTSLLLLIATHVKAQQLPTAVKRMSPDEGEKILPHYLAFAPDFSLAQSPMLARGLLSPDEELLLLANNSATLSFRPPFGVLYGEDNESPNSKQNVFRRAKDALARLGRRQYACPTDTESCDNIDQPNYCCAVGEICFVVENAPDAGNVGCCPEGQSCGGGVGNCGTGSTACPADLGGGCCIEGFSCASVG
ncbi:uncharacterized protein BCR38DRAFT_341419, partial [Pseudomassariella vexata]